MTNMDQDDIEAELDEIAYYPYDDDEGYRSVKLIPIDDEEEPFRTHITASRRVNNWSTP